MGKSRKKPDSEVDSDPAVVASPATVIENEKQVVGSKKQKIDNGDKKQDFEKKNLEKETEENTKEEQNNSSEENKVEVPQAVNTVETPQDTKRAIITNVYTRKVKERIIKEDEGKDNSKKDHQHLETPIESIEDIKSEETTEDAHKATTFIKYEEKDRDDDSKTCGTDVEMLDNSSLKKTDQTSLSSESPRSKTVLMENLSFLIKEEDVRKFFKEVGEIAEIHFEMKEDYFTGHGRVEFTTAEAAQEALKLSNTSLLDRHVKLHLATEKGEEHPTTTTPHTTGSKTVFLGNLSFSIEEDDVRDLFKDVGEIAEIRFAIRHERFLGHGHVEFTTAEAAQEALKLDQKVILDRRVKLNLARERGVSTPSSSVERSNQRGGHVQGRTLYVRGFDYSHGFDNIRSTLEKHFGKCGEVTRIHIPQDYESGAPRGVAFIDFADSSAFSQALKLDKSEIGGCKIVVEEAKKSKGEGREGFGYGGGSGGGESGSGSGGWGRGNGYGGGSGRSSGGSVGGWSRGNDYSGGSGRSSGGWSRGNDYGGGSDRSSGGSVGGGWSRGSDYGGGGSVGSGRSSGGSVGGGWSRGTDYGGGSGKPSGGSVGGWSRGGDYGGGSGRSSGGLAGGWSRGSDYGGSSGRSSGGSVGGGWSRGGDYGGGSVGGGWSRGSDYGGGSDRSSGGWRREGGSRENLGRGNGYGGDWSGGGGFNSSRVGRFGGGYGGSRGGGGSRP